VTDLTPGMIATARERLVDYKQVELAAADAQSLPYESSTFDRYIANLSLMLVPDTDGMIREASRVLKPGGIAGFSVWGNGGEASSMFTLVPSILTRLGLYPTPAAPPPPSAPVLSTPTDATAPAAATISGSNITPSASPSPSPPSAIVITPAKTSVPLTSRSTFHLGQSDANLRQRFIDAGMIIAHDSQLTGLIDIL
jgi:SAM-dependent methyltransferase